MTNNYLKRTIKTGITGALTLSLVLSAMPVSTALAKTGPHFAKSKINIEVGEKKTVKIKGIKKKLIKKIIVRSTQKKVAAAKANGKTAITVSAKKKGKARIKVTLKLKKSLNGTKNHKLILKVSVKKSTASSPTPAPTQTAEPATSTTPSPSVLPTTAPVTPAAAVLTDINQTKSDAVEFIFDTDTFLVEKEIKREDLGIDLLNEKKESIQNISVNEIITSKDGLTVTASLAKAFTDKGLYRFSYNGKTVDKVMNVGKPESIFISTSMAEKNVATPIEFTLIDGSGIDVTGANRLDMTCSIEAKGDHTSFDNSRASQTTITFDSVGQRSEVTVTYNSGADGEKDIISTPTTITCVAPTAKIGTPLHLVASKSSRKTWDDDEDGCAMFYDGGSNSVPVCYLNEENNNLFFCATDENDAVIPYDEYSVVPANRAVCDAEVIRNTERYAQIRFSGNKVGDTNLNVICTSNGVQSSYIVGVKVKERPPIRSVKIESEFAKMTNVYDEDYKSRIDISVTDTEGNKADPESYSTPVITLQSISGAKPADFKKYTQQEWSNTSFTDEQKAKIMSSGLFEKKDDGEMIFTAWGFLPPPIP
ncbi:MAG: hypothetical protein J6P16_00955 [Eubacterium sp.]|nr:hypothetical protein [Eubacterium sp.]